MQCAVSLQMSKPYTTTLQLNIKSGDVFLLHKKNKNSDDDGDK